jgi:hypothetical protein
MIMKYLLAIVLAAAYMAGGAAASAQTPALPGLPDPIPAPLPPPPQPPFVYGPARGITGSFTQSPPINGTAMSPPVNGLAVPTPSVTVPATQSPSPGLLAPPPLTTFSDRATQCDQLGSSVGLSGPNLDFYSAACANEGQQ